MTCLALALLAAWSLPTHAQTAAPGSNLPVVTVTSTADADASTEGSGSYAARSATVGSKVPVAIKETPASVSVLTRQRMDDQNMVTIQQALRYVTGVQSVDYGDGTAYFKARGNMLGVEFDGVPIVSGLQYLQQFDLAMYDRVEILRGPSGVMDGAGDPGGTVNLVRKRPQDTFHVATETQAGSFGSLRQMVDVTGPLNKDGSLRGRAVLVGSDGLQSVDGVRQKEVMAYGALDFDITPRTTLSLSAAYQNNPISGLDYGASGIVNSDQSALIGRVPGSYSQNFSPSWNYGYTSVQEANANLVHRFENGWQSQTTLFYRHELLKADYAYAGPGASASGLSSYGEQRQRNTYDWFGADTNVSGPLQLFGQTHTLTFGANYTLQSNTQNSGFVLANGPFADGTFSLYDPNAVSKVDVPFTYGANNRFEQLGVYGQARIHITQPLTLVLGAREAFYHQTAQTILPTVSDWATQAQLNHRFLPSAGLVYDIVPWLTAYASYSKFLAAQTATTYTGVGLAPRTGEQYEAGLKGSFLHNRLNATVAVFNINDNSRAITDPDHPTGSIAGGKSRDQGVELEVSGQPLRNWNVYAGYTYLNVNYENDVPNLTDGTDPKHLFKLWTNYAFTQGMLSGVTIGGGMLAQTRITRGVEQGAYAIFNAQVGYKFNKHVEASLQLNNLFNRDYYIRPPGNFYSVFGDRRNVMLTLRSDF
ncbi:TonB-dependent siderophore receptor [Paraburkholderia sp. BL21I4N1]|uniref:TonB-dependent siderophore receptor n=1 Tax=Paraburkholderia sp. BL21I4N1 TaxID=1938801 RepID=UPI000D4C10B5|nr:TonB-dependent siderophore receptor [Paraburkholderia sp. BL21I4N1]PQV54720.1 outer membrane receptor for ferric coprogen and ferric-rhodotorulic acid [Paraburkholderia sp. BL21I4N1]